MSRDDAGSGARAARRHDRQEGCLDRPRDPLPTRVDDCPPLPAGYGAALDAALTTLGIDLDRGARAAIDDHVRLLVAWNSAINLTAVRDPAAIAVRHVVDSLTALALLRGRGIDRFVDLGSGGGFPGLPLAAAVPADRALLVDSVAKKVRFLATVIEALGLEQRVVAEATRAEALAANARDRQGWPAVTARAVASLAELVELGLPLLRPGGVLIAWKGLGAAGAQAAIRGGMADVPDGASSDARDSADRDAAGDESHHAELGAARRAIAAIDPSAAIEIITALPDATAATGPLADLAGHRLIVVTRGPGAIAREWPRDPAARRRRPW